MKIMIPIAPLKKFLCLASLLVGLVGLPASDRAAQRAPRSVAPTPHGVCVTAGGLCVELECFTPAVVRVKKYPRDAQPDKQSFSVVKAPERVRFRLRPTPRGVTLVTSELSVEIDTLLRCVRFADRNGRTLLREKDSSARFSPVDDAGEPSFRVGQSFELDDHESIYGLGQHQDGRMNQRGQRIELRQVNMEICIPMIHSSKGYLLFWDNPSITEFADDDRGMHFDSEVGALCDYYFVRGADADEVIARWRDLTGEAPMMPLWTFGFHQSRERYVSQEQLVGVVKRYRELGVPLDGIVQDWQYWGDNASWNAIEFRNPLFPDPQRMLDEVHALHAHAIISVWPSFGPTTDPYRAFAEHGQLLPFETFPQQSGARVYDAYDPAARDTYWRFLDERMFRLGMDGWWLDATEPEHNPIRPGDYDARTALGSFRKVRNAYPLFSVGGVYGHQRAATSGKRVFILTRSAFAGQQRYAAASWSGDVEASWEVLARQIPAALNFTLCGIPYWNSDIGGFYSATHYPDGTNDPAYRKLYARWMQFAVCSGMMRSHGTNTPREIFQFGKPGDPDFDLQARMIHLRYRLLPYLYSTAWEITSRGGSLMRALFFDFPDDPRVAEIGDEYLFGRSFLVAPVTRPDDRRTFYLPSGARWIDFWSGEAVDGGVELTRSVPIDIFPLYVRAGAVVPMGPTVQYAAEKPWDDLQVRIYPGADGEFVLYEDAGDNYDYEQGRHTTIRMEWRDRERRLILHPREGQYDGMIERRRFRLILVGSGHGVGLDNGTSDREVEYDGRRVVVQW